MSLLTYFKPSVRESEHMTRKERKTIDECVKQAIASEDLEGSKKRGRYNSYTPEERAVIGKYAAENGPTRAARHYTKTFGHDINESTARKLRSEYLNELKVVKERDVAGQVVALPKKSQGRPLLLGRELDGVVQEYVKD